VEGVSDCQSASLQFHGNPTFEHSSEVEVSLSQPSLAHPEVQLPTLPASIKGYYRPGAVGEQNNGKLVAKLGLHARHRCRTRLRKLKGTEHLAKVIADVQFYNGERGESLPGTMMSNTTNENDFALSPKY
jgi:hypothetical protein